jgi:hypothetical protein
LVGNIPSLPSEVAAEGDLESMGFSKKQSLDWQLAVTVSFIDVCLLSLKLHSVVWYCIALQDRIEQDTSCNRRVLTIHFLLLPSLVNIL